MIYSNKHIKIDTDKKRYKKLYWTLFIPMSDGWEKLPEITQVSVAKIKVSQTMRSARTMGNESSFKFEMYVVYLVANKNKRIEVCKQKEYADAKKEAENLGYFFGLEVMDYVNEKEEN